MTSPAGAGDDADRLRRYAYRGRKSVDGWFEFSDAAIFTRLLLCQVRSAFTGAVAEIGVHHGKSFIALCLSLTAREKAFCIDLFDQQELNQDHSGSGNYEKFCENLQSAGIQLERITILKGSSDTISGQDVTAAVGPVRFFSIDGGHWETIVENDLRIAETSLADHGIVALDDFCHPHWPDVTIGYANWRAHGERSLVPFAIGANKLYLCRPDFVEVYQGAISQSPVLHTVLTKNIQMDGITLPVYAQGGLSGDVGWKSVYYYNMASRFPWFSLWGRNLEI